MKSGKERSKKGNEVVVMMDGMEMKLSFWMMKGRNAKRSVIQKKEKVEFVRTRSFPPLDRHFLLFHTFIFLFSSC